jgi:hypothetical protein
MKDIIEIPTGDILKVTDKQFDSLRKSGLILYVTGYNNVEINGYVFYNYYKQDIFDFLDRTGIEDFKKLYEK